jgi:hypothetical protein
MSATAHANTVATTQITGFKISTSADARLTVSGRLSATGVTVSAGQSLTVQIARDDHTGWRTLPLAKGLKPLTTQAGGAFSGKFYVGYPHGYYRIRYAGSTTLAATTSKEVRDPRVNAVVFSWKVSPRKIHKGAYVTFSGVLKQKPGSVWKPLPGRLVYIVGRIKGSKTWYWYARPKTDSQGRFKAKIKITKDSYWEYLYRGDKTHYFDYPLKSVFVNVI